MSSTTRYQPWGGARWSCPRAPWRHRPPRSPRPRYRRTATPGGRDAERCDGRVPSRAMSLPLSTIVAAPKAMLHDHLDGGLRPATMIDLAAEYGYAGLPSTDPA